METGHKVLLTGAAVGIMAYVHGLAAAMVQEVSGPSAFAGFLAAVSIPLGLVSLVSLVIGASLTFDSSSKSLDELAAAAEKRRIARGRD